MFEPVEDAYAFCKRYPEAVAGGDDKVKGVIRWVVVTIVKDVASYVITIISVIGLLVTVQVFNPDYFDILFIPIMIGVPLIIAMLETFIYGKRKG